MARTLLTPETIKAGKQVGQRLRSARALAAEWRAGLRPTPLFAR